MNARDKEIYDDIIRFRVLSRDIIADLHFSNVKNQVTASNYVLKRLRRDGYITCALDRKPYLYFPAENHIKKDSTKIPHFLKIAEFYRDICKIEKPKKFVVEPRYGINNVAPDVFMIWKGMPWHVEIQRTVYSPKQMGEKLEKYDRHFLGETWKTEAWQPAERKIYPYLWIIGEGSYNIGIRSYKVFQNTIEEMLELMNKQRQTR